VGVMGIESEACARASLPVAQDLLRLQAAILGQRGFAAGTAALATELCDRLHCDRVAVGWVESDCSRIVALSHAADFDPRQALVERIAAAMDEALEQASTVAVPPRKGAPPQVALAHLELAGTDGRAVCTVLLAEAGKPVGALTFERASKRFTAHETSFCEDVAALAAPILSLKRRAERGWAASTAEALRGVWSKLASPEARHVRFALAACAPAAAALLFVPVPYHVSAPARVESSVQRVVSAPVDGFLEQVNVRPGDLVKAGQLLAQLATQDLQAERLKRRSELAQHENVYKAALARADRTQLVINQARAAEAQAQLALVDNHLQRAQLRAPFDGIVIKGDLPQQLGAPVRRGEVLLTLAPDERYRLIIEVDERDAALIGDGLPGKLALAALPEDLFEFKVARLLPVAVAADGRNFFEVEGALEASGNTLRPGMRGVAKIAAGRRSPAWIATHRLIDWLRLAAWSMGA
jgi:multidrug efflux pump subunit AcrA (membrane-fusion protein)